MLTILMVKMLFFDICLTGHEAVGLYETQNSNQKRKSILSMYEWKESHLDS